MSSKFGKIMEKFLESAVDTITPLIVGKDYNPGPDNDSLIAHAAASDKRLDSVASTVIADNGIYAPQSARQLPGNHFKS